MWDGQGRCWSFAFQSFCTLLHHSLPFPDQIFMMEPETQEELLPGPSWLPQRWDPECPVHQHLMEAAKCLRETGRFEDAWPRGSCAVVYVMQSTSMIKYVQAAHCKRRQNVRDVFDDLGSIAQLHGGLPEALEGFESTASRLFSHISPLFCIPAQRPRCFSHKLRPSTAGAM